MFRVKELLHDPSSGKYNETRERKNDWNVKQFLKWYDLLNFIKKKFLEFIENVFSEIK